KFPRAEVSLVVGERAQTLFESDPRFKKIWVWRKNAAIREKWPLVLEIIGKGFNRVVNFRMPVLVRNGTTHRRIMHFQKTGAGLKPAPAESLDQIDTRQALWISERVEQQTRELLKKEGVSIGEKWIVVTPGSLNMTKRWKIDGFVKLCRLLSEKDSSSILLTGDESDRVRSQEIIGTNIFDLCGKTGLLQLAWLIREAKLLISHDSAPLHMAGLFGTPVVAIFGPTDPLKYGPWRENSRIVRRDLFCSPCEKSLCVYHHECMEQIAPQEILQAVNELIS
ncbi:MAG: glycosyltransferase family 9 protein, partial [Candidatus Omnitrophica bacterium]|nr:glycosyltransferase family 9 protein [Candidatus Omnitrophota bacterium]